LIIPKGYLYQTTVYKEGAFLIFYMVARLPLDFRDCMHAGLKMMMTKNLAEAARHDK
jgi:hypothetical protein